MRTVIITGGACGIGRAIARRFLENTHAVVIADIDTVAAKKTVQQLADLGPVCFIRCDVASESSVENMCARTVKKFNRIDVLVNNAAIGISRHLSKLSFKDWQKVIGVNLSGPFLCAKATWSQLKKRNGCIINIASTRALMSEANTEAYSASKGGIRALSHAMSVSLGPEVRVNCILPGWIDVSADHGRPEKLSRRDHSQHPVGRVGKAEDIASCAFFLADPANSFITGQDFVVDGGMTRKMIYED